MFSVGDKVLVRESASPCLFSYKDKLCIITVVRPERAGLYLTIKAEGEEAINVYEDEIIPHQEEDYEVCL